MRVEAALGLGPGGQLSAAPLGSTVAFGSGLGAVVLWDWRADRRTELPAPPATALCFSPDGEALAVAGADGRLRVWRVGPAAELVSEVAPVGLGQVRRLGWSPDGSGLLGLAAGRAGRCGCQQLRLSPERVTGHPGLHGPALGCFGLPDARCVPRPAGRSPRARWVLVTAATASLWLATDGTLQLLAVQRSDDRTADNPFVAAALDDSAPGAELVYVVRRHGQLCALSTEGLIAERGGGAARASECTALAVGTEGVYVGTSQGAVIVLDRQSFVVARKVDRPPEQLSDSPGQVRYQFGVRMHLDPTWGALPKLSAPGAALNCLAVAHVNPGEAELVLASYQDNSIQLLDIQATGRWVTRTDLSCRGGRSNGFGWGTLGGSVRWLRWQVMRACTGSDGWPGGLVTAGEDQTVGIWVQHSPVGATQLDLRLERLVDLPALHDRSLR